MSDNALTFTTQKGTGVLHASGFLYYIVLNADQEPIYATVSRRMKDACFEAEAILDMHWDRLAALGFKVFKVSGHGHDVTRKGLVSYDGWVDDFDEREIEENRQKLEALK